MIGSCALSCWKLQHIHAKTLAQLCGDDIIPAMADKLERYAGRMRRQPTPAESRLYNALLIALHPFSAELKFQEVVGYYIADFMIYPARVCIECDGAHHFTSHGAAYDKRRETTMRNAGIRTLRFENGRIMRDTTRVVAEIIAFCGDFKEKVERTPLGSPIVQRLAPGRALNKRGGRKRWSEGMFYRTP